MYERDTFHQDHLNELSSKLLLQFHQDYWATELLDSGQIACYFWEGVGR